MEIPPVVWKCPPRIEPLDPSEPVAVRKAGAISLKLRHMPVDLWKGQLIAGSMTLEKPRIHAEWGFPDYLSAAEHRDARKRGLGIYCFGHIVPDYPRLLRRGLRDIQAEAKRLESKNLGPDDGFFSSVVIALDGVMAYAMRLSKHCREMAEAESEPIRRQELRQMAQDLEQVPAGPAQTFRQALQSVWLLHMIFHSTLNGNAMGRLDQYAWPFLKADLDQGRLDMVQALELVECFCLKFNERARTTEDQKPDSRQEEPLDLGRRTRHHTSSQVGRQRDRLDAANHWLQNIVIGGLTPEGRDGTNGLSHLLLESYDRNKMTNPLLTLRVHQNTPDSILEQTCEVLKAGGGMPALFNDKNIIAALKKTGVLPAHARDYTNDGCWEVILPGRTDFRFQRLSLMLCLERALNLGKSRLTGEQGGPQTSALAELNSFEKVWDVFERQMDAMISDTVAQVGSTANDRNLYAPVPLLSALIDGPLETGKDMTAGGAFYRTYGMLAEGVSHTIDSLAAIEAVVFEQGLCDMETLGRALESNFQGHELLKRRLEAAPKYGNDLGAADSMGLRVLQKFAALTEKHAKAKAPHVSFVCGAGTFSWYIAIGEGLAASPDGRKSGEPVASNISPSLGRDVEGLPAAILSHARLTRTGLPAGGPLDLRVSKKLVQGEEGTRCMAALIRSFCDLGGSMMTLTVADAEELRAAQENPDSYRSLRVRMGGWSAYFTMLSREQQDHHIQRQEGSS